MPRSLLALFFALSCANTTKQDACQQINTPQTFRCLSLSTYRDKMHAAWLGQMIGVAYGQPVEFRYLGKIIPEKELPTWRPALLRNAFFEDDLHVEVGFLDTLSQHGLNVSRETAASDFAKTSTALWHANGASRERVRAGLTPSGEHPHANDISFQIEADFSGLVSPGLPSRAVLVGEVFGGLICNKDCLYGGQFIGCMYAEAFFTSEPKTLIEAGLACIPKESEYAKTIEDALVWSQQNPRWEDTWQLVEAKYNSPEKISCKGSGEGKEAAGFNINASINGAYVVMGLVYGDKDPTKTLQLATRAGQDADCNPSSALGLLFTTIGLSKLPTDYQLTPSPTWLFSGTKYNFDRLLEVTEKLARQSVVLGGGKVERTPSGAEVFLLPTAAQQIGIDAQ